MPDLIIYKASAGSGKTYRLTWNYLVMLYRDPRVYRHILAVTFTNKAAGEMKARILESLYRLASGDPAVDAYRAGLVQETGKEADDVNRQAREILTMILNDYSAFHISTIDKFFQTVIRGFTREIGLQSGYNLELNSDRVLSEAVDRLMQDLNDDKWLREWMIRFADERIFNGRQWDPNRDIFRLGKEVFREEYRQIFDNPMIQDEFEEKIAGYSRRLAETINSITALMKKTGREALEAIHAGGLEVDDFSNKQQGAAGYFVKIAESGMVPPGKRVESVLEDPSRWATNSSPRKTEIENLATHFLTGKLREAVDLYESNISRYNTANAIYRNIFAFGILNHISLKIREVADEKNLFLLSDATWFLKKIIEGNPTPFVFEKAGNYFSHFMLDEFQDTSGFQWQNFAPLIGNALAQACGNLIVGDVKQSIYRWRNSDWMILEREVEKTFSRFGSRVEPLNENWRSGEDIVRFNNSLFGNAPGVIAALVENDTTEAGVDEAFADGWKDLVSGIYRDSLQSVPEKFRGSGGYVTASFHDVPPDDYALWLKEQLPVLIGDLQDRGYAARDITILVRKGSEGRDIASMLLAENNRLENEDHNFNVISNDSLYLVSNPAVNFLTAVLGFLRNPADQINLGFIRHEYMRYLALDGGQLPDLNTLFLDGSETGNFHRVFRRFYNELDRIRFLPLYELSEQLIAIFELNSTEENLPYIQAFQDIILDFVRNETADINAFSDYWEKNGSQATLNISEAQDAIRIMTIHKSKGLQFRVVIIPFCHWSLTPETSGSRDLFLWCSTEGTEFNELEHVPVKYQKDLLNSAFRDDYLREKFHSYIDNLNLLYVAFTRAEEELHMMSGKVSANGLPQNVGSLAHGIIRNGTDPGSLFPTVGLAGYYDDDQRRFAFGSPHHHEADSRRVKAREQGAVRLTDYPVSDPRQVLKLNVRNAWLSGMQEDMARPVGYGTVMHEILSGIRKKDDLEKAVNKAYTQGKITGSQREEIMQVLSRELGRDEVSVWFSDSVQVKTEQEMVPGRKEILRPDRVVYLADHIAVIDYKFGSAATSHHRAQVKEYMHALQSIETFPVRGYLWYVGAGKIEEMNE